MFDDFFATSAGGTPSLGPTGTGNARLADLISGAPPSSASPTAPTSLAARIQGDPRPAVTPPTTPPPTSFDSGMPPVSVVTGGGAMQDAYQSGALQPPSAPAPLTGLQGLAQKIRQFSTTPGGMAIQGALSGLAATANPYHPGLLGSLGQGFETARQGALQQQQVQYERQRQMSLDRLQQLIGGSEIARNNALAGMDTLHGNYWQNRGLGQYREGSDGSIYWLPTPGVGGPGTGLTAPYGQAPTSGAPGTPSAPIVPGSAPTAPAPAVAVTPPRPGKPKAPAIDPLTKAYAGIVAKLTAARTVAGLPLYDTPAKVQAAAQQQMQAVYHSDPRYAGWVKRGGFTASSGPTQQQSDWDAAAATIANDTTGKYRGRTAADVLGPRP